MELTAELLKHEDTAWVRKVIVIIDGKKYPTTFEWTYGDGYELIFTHEEVIAWIDANDLYPHDLCQQLDDLTFEQVK